MASSLGVEFRIHLYPGWDSVWFEPVQVLNMWLVSVILCVTSVVSGKILFPWSCP